MNNRTMDPLRTMIACLALATLATVGALPAAAQPAEGAEAGAAPAPAAEADAAEADAADADEAADAVVEPAGLDRPDDRAAAPVDAGSDANVVGPAAAYARPRCVKIYGAGIGREHGYATGILVSEAGHILTAQGIYLAGSRIRAVTDDGKVHRAKVVRRDEGLQVALLKIDAETPQYFDVAEEPAVDVGDWVVAVSNAFNVADAEEEPLSVMLGITSLRGKLETQKRALDFDVATDVLLVDAIVSNPGAPGGALVTVDGRLAGLVGKILEAKTTNTRLNYAIPNDLLAAFLAGQSFDPDDKPKARAGEAYLGIRLFKLSGRKAPAYVDRVARRSPAFKAGLKKDDLILTLNGEWVRSIEEYEELFDDLRPGDRVELTVKRGREVMVATLTAAKDD